MTDHQTQLRKAERLKVITQSLGFALWQLQALEDATAQHYVLVALSTRGMGIDAGNKLDESVKGNTFGKTIHALRKAGKLPEALELRFLSLLNERNWLVHNSRATNRTAIFNDESCHSILERLEQIAEEARLLIHEIGTASSKFVIKHGVSNQEVERLTQEVLSSWHSSTTD